MSVFLYGTLRYLPLLRLVLGRSPDADLQAARLTGHRVCQAKGQDFPLIQPSQGATSEGLLLTNPSDEDLARLDFYEGGFGYTLSPVTVETDQGPAEAQVYFPDDGLWQAGPDWQLDEWVARNGALTLRAAAEVMERKDTNTAQHVARLFPFIRARAWASMLAERGTPTSLRYDAKPGDIEVEHINGGYDGFFRLRPYRLRHRTFKAGFSDWFERETFFSYDAALVLPYDPVTDSILLVEQWRGGPMWRGDPVAWTLEPIAGLVDAGENPADTARREAQEEAGLTLGDLQPILKGYPSPGYSTEFFHCFVGICDLSGPRADTSGLADENEDIRSHVITFDHAMKLLDTGEITALPLASMLLWLARHRDHLRASA